MASVPWMPSFECLRQLHAKSDCHAERDKSGLQRLDALAGGSLAASILQPLRTHSMRCLVQLEGAAAAAAPPAAASPAADARPPAGAAASAFGAIAAVQQGLALPEVCGSGAQTPGASHEDIDAMLVVQRLIYALDRVLEVLRH